MYATSTTFGRGMVMSSYTSDQQEMNSLLAKLQERALEALSDPVSEQSRKLRRLLLGVSAIAIFVAEGRLVPKKITALGLTVEDLDQVALLNVASLVVIFLLISFIIYSSSDFQSALIKFRAYRGDAKTASASAATWFRSILARRRKIWNITIIIRCIWEFIIPVFIGLYAAYTLYTADLSTAPSKTSLLDTISGLASRV